MGPFRYVCILSLILLLILVVGSMARVSHKQGKTLGKRYGALIGLSVGVLYGLVQLRFLTDAYYPVDISVAVCLGGTIFSIIGLFVGFIIDRRNSKSQEPKS